MGKRISELASQPALTESDYLVIDSSASGGKTRKTKATESFILVGQTPPLASQGVLGSTYVQYDDHDNVVNTWYKLPAGWSPAPEGGSYVQQIEITEQDVSTSTFSVTFTIS